MKGAWVTLATNDSYSLGALVLAHSLKQVGTTQELAVLVTPGVTNSMRARLSEVYNLVQEVNVLDSRDKANLRLLQRPELGITFTKLHCWRLTHYEKCVFLDADTLVLQNCDELFDREELSAAPDVGWPDCFNSGVFVYRPSGDTYDKLIQFALDKGSFDGGDQGLLNLYFSDWAHKDISKHLPFIYNVCSTAFYSYLPAFKQFGKDVKIIHFIGNAKPWLQYFDTETQKVRPSGELGHLAAILQRWWDIFCSVIHPNLSPDMSGLAGAFARLTLGQQRSPEQEALEDSLRRQNWEQGNIDYLGKDSFENIWSKICETLAKGPPQEPVAAEPQVASELQTASQPQDPQLEQLSQDKATVAEASKDEPLPAKEPVVPPSKTQGSPAPSGEDIVCVLPAHERDIVTPEIPTESPPSVPLQIPAEVGKIPESCTVASATQVPTTESAASPENVGTAQVTTVSSISLSDPLEAAGQRPSSVAEENTPEPVVTASILATSAKTIPEPAVEPASAVCALPPPVSSSPQVSLPPTGIPSAQIQIPPLKQVQLPLDQGQTIEVQRLESIGSVDSLPSAEVVPTSTTVQQQSHPADILPTSAVSVPVAHPSSTQEVIQKSGPPAQIPSPPIADPTPLSPQNVAQTRTAPKTVPEETSATPACPALISAPPAQTPVPSVKSPATLTQAAAATAPVSASSAQISVTQKQGSAESGKSTQAPSSTSAGGDACPIAPPPRKIGGTKKQGKSKK